MNVVYFPMYRNGFQIDTMKDGREGLTLYQGTD